MAISHIADVKSVYCQGFNCLQQAQISNGQLVNATGEKCLAKALIENVYNINVSGLNCLSEAEIHVDKLSYTNNSYITIDGINKDHFFKIYCNSTMSCFIHCKSADSCQKIKINCDGTCHLTIDSCMLYICLFPNF